MIVVDNLQRAIAVAENKDTPSNQGLLEGESRKRFGFRMPEPAEEEFAFSGRDEDYPELWQEQTRNGEI